MGLNILHGLAVVGVFMLNFVIYEVIIAIIQAAILLPFFKVERVSEKAAERAFLINILAGYAAFSTLIVLYCTNVWRLIPLPS
jgi:hypothetical protein